MPKALWPSRSSLTRKGNGSIRQNHPFLLQFWVSLSFIPNKVRHICAAYQKSYFNPNSLMERCILWTVCKNDGRMWAKRRLRSIAMIAPGVLGTQRSGSGLLECCSRIAARRRQYAWFDARNEMIYLLWDHYSTLEPKCKHLYVYAIISFDQISLVLYIRERNCDFSPWDFSLVLPLEREKRTFA